jgi:hypothetical protein
LCLKWREAEEIWGKRQVREIEAWVSWPAFVDTTIGGSRRRERNCRPIMAQESEVNKWMTGCVNNKMAAASVSHFRISSESLCYSSCLTINTQERKFWQITSNSYSQVEKILQLIKYVLLECNTNIWFTRSGIGIESLHIGNFLSKCDVLVQETQIKNSTCK